MLEIVTRAMPARRITRQTLTARQLMAIERLETEWRGIVGSNIRKARQAAGLTLEQLAAQADVSRNYLSLAELGRTGMTIDFLARISFALGKLPPDFLSQD